MKNYEFVPKNQVRSLINNLLRVIKLVQKELKGKLDFSHRFEGPLAHNMILCDYENNLGYEFDIDLILDFKNGNKYDPKETKVTLMELFNKYGSQLKFSRCKNEKRFFRMEINDEDHREMIHKINFRIKFVHKDKIEQYIDYNSKNANYFWEFWPIHLLSVEDQYRWCADNNLEMHIRQTYLVTKNNETRKISSYSQFAESVNTVHIVYNKDAK
ncbi:hypothetical protein NPA07_04630 [Mycoplasmopsis caviae]|uniref:Nucleotidyltransferase n=1 Tax=Mycoplasmopsis caviae TaxID=55603 RepID=A0A3P8LAY8_9BACT|nr:hypothetical protein [Mycoplasmopsis caviae]UUD35063.1 hypothetical protein NPA07_04630 [Mycoplasmopsis caviae]VDR42111.1 Uncharacterised protein [Mycoplasmopsis caviae]